MEWVVLLRGITWSDRFDCEDDCIEHIESESERLGILKEEFECRPMTNKEMSHYD